MDDERDSRLCATSSRTALTRLSAYEKYGVVERDRPQQLSVSQALRRMARWTTGLGALAHLIELRGFDPSNRSTQDFSGHADDLVATITWEATARPVLRAAGNEIRNSGASKQSDVIGQIVTLVWVGLKASDCTTSAGRGLLL